MYIAYYIMRCDGDADLCAVVEDGEAINEDLATTLISTIEEGFENSLEDWFKVKNSECDFPDVWDLTSTYFDH